MITIIIYGVILLAIGLLSLIPLTANSQSGTLPSFRMDSIIQKSGSVISRYTQLNWYMSPESDDSLVTKNWASGKRGLMGRMDLPVSNAAQTAFNLKVNISDTASMLSKYLRANAFTKAAVVALGIVATSDTSAMLSPYLRSNVGAATYYPLSGNPSSFLTASSITGKLNVSDSAAMLSPYLRKIDTASLSNRINLKGIGTVTSIGLTSTDFAVSNTPVTSSGNVTANLTTTGVPAGIYGLVTVDTKGRVTLGKRQELYSGTTNGSGVYTVVFGTAYSVAPNIQASLPAQSATNQYLRVSAVSTTGFTVNAYSFNTNNLLGIISLITTTSAISSMAVDVLITEK